MVSEKLSVKRVLIQSKHAMKILEKSLSQRPGLCLVFIFALAVGLRVMNFQSLGGRAGLYHARELISQAICIAKGERISRVDVKAIKPTDNSLCLSFVRIELSHFFMQSSFFLPSEFCSREKRVHRDIPPRSAASIPGLLRRQAPSPSLVISESLRTSGSSCARRHLH